MTAYFYNLDPLTGFPLVEFNQLKHDEILPVIRSREVVDIAPDQSVFYFSNHKRRDFAYALSSRRKCFASLEAAQASLNADITEAVRKLEWTRSMLLDRQEHISEVLPVDTL